MDTLNHSGAPDEDFPLVTLSPVGNSRHAWSALMLASEPPAGRNSLASMARLFGELDLSEALGSLACILPLADPDSLDDDLAAQLPAGQVVLLVPVERCADPAAGPSLDRLCARGFRLMADGVPAAGLALSAAISAVASDGRSLPASLSHLPGPHLATGVDDPARFKQAQSAGYAWFAGDYPLHPSPGKAQHEGSSRTLLLRLLAMVTSDAHSREIEALLKQDSSLSYHLLKLVNSVSFSLSTTITSFAYAITLLGRRQLQRWLQLLIYAQQKSEDAASPLLARAARRASLMEALCQKVGASHEDQDHAFMTGMFSLLDALFGLPLEKIVTPLNLSDEVENALLSKSGRLGGLLAIVEASERVPGPALGAQLAAASLTPAAYAQALVHSCRWAIQVSRET